MKFGDHDVVTDVDDVLYVRYVAQFDNGYGASIIWFSTWAPEHYEVCLMKFDGAGWYLDWTHEDFPSELANLSPQEVGRVLDRIKELTL